MVNKAGYMTGVALTLWQGRRGGKQGRVYERVGRVGGEESKAGYMRGVAG